MPFGKAFDILVKPPPPDSRAALALRPPSLWRRASSSPRTKQRVRLFSSFHDIPDASGLKQRAGGRQQESSGSCERKHAAEAAGRKRNIPILHKCAEDYRAVCKDGKSKPEGPYVTVSKLLVVAVASIFVDVAVNEFEGILTWQNASVGLTEALKLARFPFQPSVVSLVGSQARCWAIALIMTAERAASYVAVQTLIFTTYAHAHRKVGILLLQPSVHSIAKQARVAIHQLAEMSLVHVCRSTFQQWTQHVATISFSDAVRAAQQNVEFIFEPSTVHDVGAAAQKYAADLPQHVVLAVEKYAIFVAQHAAVEELCSTAREYATVFGKFKLSEWLPYFFVFSTCGKVIILSL